MRFCLTDKIRQARQKFFVDSALFEGSDKLCANFSTSSFLHRLAQSFFFLLFGFLLTSHLAYLFLLLVFLQMWLRFFVFYNNLTNRNARRYFMNLLRIFIYFVQSVFFLFFFLFFFVFLLLFFFFALFRRTVLDRWSFKTQAFKIFFDWKTKKCFFRPSDKKKCYCIYIEEIFFYL